MADDALFLKQTTLLFGEFKCFRVGTKNSSVQREDKQVRYVGDSPKRRTESFSVKLFKQDSRVCKGWGGGLCHKKAKEDLHDKRPRLFWGLLLVAASRLTVALGWNLDRESDRLGVVAAQLAPGCPEGRRGHLMSLARNQLINCPPAQHWLRELSKRGNKLTPGGLSASRWAHPRLADLDCNHDLDELPW